LRAWAYIASGRKETISDPPAHVKTRRETAMWSIARKANGRRREVRRFVALTALGLPLACASLLAPIGASVALARTAYVSSEGSGVTPINLADNTAGKTIVVGREPVLGAITPDGKTAYVSNSGSASVTPINVATNTAGTPITVGSEPARLAITPDGKTAYVPDKGEGRVTPIDLTSNTAGAPVMVGKEPKAVAITPDGKTAYVSNFGSASVTPINLATSTAGAPIMVGLNPEGIAITPDGKTAYVSNFGSTSVTPINLATGTAGAPIMVGGAAAGIAITPDGKTAYVSAGQSGWLTPIDLASNTPRTPIAVGGVPDAVAITPNGGSAYVANALTGSLTPIDLASNTVGTPIMAGAEPEGVAIVPDSGPAAAFSVSAAPAGQSTSFDASASSDPESTVTSYAWSLGDGASATTSSSTLSHVYARPGTYTVTLRVTDGEGCSSVFLFTGQTAYCSAASKAITSRDVTVGSAPTIAPIISSALPTPTISEAHQSASRWRVGNKAARISTAGKRPVVGTTFSFSLNEQASVSLSFSELLRGRKVGRRCVAKTPKNARHKRCTRTLAAGTLSFGGHTGANTVSFQGRISSSRRLVPGRYTLIITATNSAGVRSAPASLSFTIVG
jgi:YVTN family beta-propeller protein